MCIQCACTVCCVYSVHMHTIQNIFTKMLKDVGMEVPKSKKKVQDAKAGGDI